MPNRAPPRHLASESIHSAATRRWLDRLLATLPALAWSQPVIDTLLQLVNTMADACDAGYGDEVRPPSPLRYAKDKRPRLTPRATSWPCPMHRVVGSR